MKGIEEAEKFYLQAGAKMLEDEFPEYVSRIAVGLVGHGSECYGYDDAVSRDHDFNVGFAMWLTDEDEEKIGFRLVRAYQKLKEAHFSSSSRLSAMGESPDGVRRTSDFYSRYTGSKTGPKSNLDWLYTDGDFFFEATNGKVFRDDLGEFSAIRSRILFGMPEDVRLKKLAAGCLSMARSGQYNYSRCLAHGEEGAAMIALANFVKSALDVIFLLNKRHCPYFKWAFRALGELEKLSDLKAPLEYLLTSENDAQGKKVKQELVEDIAHSVIKEIEAQGLAQDEDDYLEPFAYKIHAKIKDAELKNMHIMIG